MNKFKKAQVIMLPATNSKTPVIKQTYDSGVGPNTFLTTKKQVVNTPSYYEYFHLYITTDDEIKEGDWLIWNDKIYHNSKISFIGVDYSKCKKVVATTNPELGHGNKNGAFYHLPKIPQWFINRYCQLGGGINNVAIEYKITDHYGDEVAHCEDGYYSKMVYEGTTVKLVVDSDNYVSMRLLQELWSKEELILIIKQFRRELTMSQEGEYFDEDKWIEDNLI